MSEVSIEENQGKEAMDLADDQNKNKHVLAALLEESGLDLSGEFGAGSFMSMLKAMSDPDFTKKIFETLKDMSAGGDGAAGIAAISELLGATNDNKGADNSVSHTSPEVDVKQGSEEKASSDLGGVDGTAVTYTTPDKSADIQVEGSPSIKAAVNEGSSIVTGAFNNNVTAEGTQVSATVDQDAVAKVAPIDPALDGQDPNVVDSLVVHSM